MAISVIIVVVIIVAFYNPIVLRTILVEKAEIPVAWILQGVKLVNRPIIPFWGVTEERYTYF